MAEKPDTPETPKILEEISRKTQAKAGTVSKRRAAGAGFRSALLLFFVLVFAVAVVYMGYQQTLLQSELATLQEQNRQLNLNLGAQGSQLGELQQQLSQPVVPAPVDDSAVREVEASLNTEIRTLQQQLAALQSEQLASSDADAGWKILEAEYLAALASQKLQLESDIDSAIGLLQRADAALLASGESGVFAARQAVATDLAQLQSLQAVDRQGIYLRIANLVDQVDNVDLLNSMRQNFEDQRGQQSQPIEIGSANGGMLDATFDFLGSVFVWRRWEETPEAMLAPGQEASIKQSFRLLLEQAQLALLQRDVELYRQSLASGRQWLQRYAVTDAAAGQNLVAELEQLDAIDIAPTLPSLAQSVNIIQQLASRER